MLFSIIIPFKFHRLRALECVRAWVSTQELPADEFELICVLPRKDQDLPVGSIKALLRRHDCLVFSDEIHDMSECAEGATQARGDFLFFTESHVWPDRDVLKAAKQRFDQCPDLVGFSCRTISVAERAIARMEADFYEHAINHGMTVHPWRKVNDQCFVIRRRVYFDIGGLDFELGHYAEWELAARCFDRGLMVGYAPDIILRHYYSGDLIELRAFTESFVIGEISFFARGRRPGDVAIWEEVPPEWSRRGRWSSKLATAMTACVRKAAYLRRFEPNVLLTLSSHYLKWSIVARWGAGLSLAVAQLRVIWTFCVLCITTSVFGLNRVKRFESYIGALVHLQRLKEITARLSTASEAIFSDAEFIVDDSRLESGMAGFHLVESFDCVPMRWSEPAALIELSVPPDCCRIAIHCAPLRHPLMAVAPMFFVNEVPIPRKKIVYFEHSAIISFNKTRSGQLRLAWICDPFLAPNDSRRLGLPVTKITIEARAPFY